MVLLNQEYMKNNLIITKTRCRCGSFEEVVPEDLQATILQVHACAYCKDSLLAAKNQLVNENNQLHERVRQLEEENKKLKTGQPAKWVET